MILLHSYENAKVLHYKHSFVPFVVSSLGELSREAYQFREELVAMFRAKCMAEPSSVLPLTPARASADFRVRFTNELMQCTAVGLASIATSAGRPFIKYGQPNHMYVRRC